MLDRVGTAGYMENSKDKRVVSEIIDDLGEAVVNFWVSGDLESFTRAPFRQLNCSRLPVSGPGMVNI